MSQDKIKVLYIAGWGRSGSTLLARILGQIDGFFHGGELRTIWVDGLKPKSICGCGVQVKECNVWNQIFDRAFGGINTINRSEMIQLSRLSEPRTYDVLISSLVANQKKHLLDRLEDYHHILDKLYHAIAKVTNSRVIVDDSLHPGYAYTLSLMPNIDLYIIHLIRDARGSAYSWGKRQKKGLGSYSLRESALGWTLRNMTLEMLKKNLSSDKYLQVFYEDFVIQPKKMIEQIVALVGERPSSLSFMAENEVKLGITHSVFGNPDRSKIGAIKIKLDNEWKSNLKLTEKGLITALSFPYLFKYGYIFPTK